MLWTYFFYFLFNNLTYQWVVHKDTSIITWFILFKWFKVCIQLNESKTLWEAFIRAGILYIHSTLITIQNNKETWYVIVYIKQK